MSLDNKMKKTIDLTWQYYQNLKSNSFMVKSSIPILYFGDFEKYEGSEDFKVVTVGLNPSCNEFPQNSLIRFLNSKGLENKMKLTDSEMELYKESLDSYFESNPYKNWFDMSFEKILNGLNCSYYSKNNFRNRALHIDICTPIATDPTWGKLSKQQQKLLENGGEKVFNELINYLEPDIMIVSVASGYLKKLKINKNKGQVIKEFLYKKDGEMRKEKYITYEYDIKLINGKNVHVFFGQAATVPYGLLSYDDKSALGKSIWNYMKQDAV